MIAGMHLLEVDTAETGLASAIRRYAAHHSVAPGRGLTPHLHRLEAESIEILREVAAEFRKPVMLYSIGKDSGVMLHLARKAFFPAPIPFPLLHVDTTWKFREMIAFRDLMASELGLELHIHVNREGIIRGTDPITSPTLHTQLMKTEALKQALDGHRFDAALGGARRDEDKSRAKERIFSFRSVNHVWDPRNQRPELWNLFNTRIREGESVRVFPLSNWTEMDVWSYIATEDIPVVPLYFAKPRPVVRRSGTLIVVDDERLPLEPGETPELLNVRFRTLGCYPLTGALVSNAANVGDIVAEMRASTKSERQGRLIDHDEAASMERKKREGYF
jgi:sulfate adenylyltransferase subunit 2